MDTSKDPTLPFKVLHFIWYNRYAAHVYGQGEEPPPQSSNKKGRKKKKTNSSQRIPHGSKDLQKHPVQYCLLQQIYAPVFSWIDAKIQKHFPKIHQELLEFANTLPLNDVSVASPFTGFVINMNVSTLIHRDWQDHHLCVVTVISDCVGGELVLQEPGLVLQLRSGDMVIFPSARISHFNLHFHGERGSLVCHSDRHFLSWTQKERNKWAHNTLFRSS
ncbi:hypothetical protein BDN72DRAFT_780876 [Pluteus cervinus]|uniref:Uncharacterized protein n=1 Tax=Pluteus cervinus TaxID=181527 RepID=A0ACD3A0W4_9AGAR|nr:hypothetical protein BDN72DRAFT_780876 [Pluteus cervinus]